MRIALPADTPLRTGMTADCNILIDRREDALLIPIGAVVDGKVWLVADGRLVRRPVTLGAGAGTDAGLVEVREGLEPEDRIVTDPGERLREGRRVRLSGGA